MRSKSGHLSVSRFDSRPIYLLMFLRFELILENLYHDALIRHFLSDIDFETNTCDKILPRGLGESRIIITTTVQFAFKMYFFDMPIRGEKDRGKLKEPSFTLSLVLLPLSR